MHSLHKHIGVALLVCSFILFGLWAMPYAGGLDAFSLSSSLLSSSNAVASEHVQFEEEMKSLHKSYATAATQEEIRVTQDAVRETVSRLFEDENPNGELLRGDAVYLAAIYAATLGKPCESSIAEQLCARLGGATEIVDLEASRLHINTLEDDHSLFADVSKGDWYTVYVGMLVAMDALDPNLDAALVLNKANLFQPNTAVFAADFDRWLYRVQRGETPKESTFAPAQGLTKKQGKDMLLKRLDDTFAARASRR